MEKNKLINIDARREVLHPRTTPEADYGGGAEGLHLAPRGREPATPLMTLVTRRQAHHLLLRSTGFSGDDWLSCHTTLWCSLDTPLCLTGPFRLLLCPSTLAVV